MKTIQTDPSEVLYTIEYLPYLETYSVHNHKTGELREHPILTTLLRGLIRDQGGK